LVLLDDLPGLERASCRVGLPGQEHRG
jgi:hypothetical protein